MRNLGNKKIMSKNIKRLMDEKGVTPKEMSKAINVPYTTILSWLKEDNYPRIDKVELMAKYFGVMKSDLYEDKMTEEKEKDNEIQSDIIVRMRTDEDFRAAVVSLYKLDPTKIRGVNEMLLAFEK